MIFMTATGSAVKHTAKTALKNNWPKAAAVCVIPVCAWLIVGLTTSLTAFVANEAVGTVLFAVLSFFLLLPLFLGVIRFFWRMIFGADDSPVSVFYWFSGKSNYLRAVKLELLLAVRALFFGLILFIPAMIVDLFSGSFLYDALKIPIPLWTSNLYYLSLFVISKSTMLDFIYLFFSLLGWIILSVLVIPIMFTLPYIITSVSVHTRFAIAEYNKRVDKQNSETFPTFVAGI